VRAPGPDLGAAQLLDHCRASPMACKLPKVVRFVDALPKSTVGKILRRELRDVR